MALRSMAAVLSDADASGHAVGAFNVSDVLQAEAVLEAASRAKASVIVQTLAGVSPYLNEDLYWALLRRTVEAYPDVDVALHLDHGPDALTCRRAVDAGFTSVMIDGSLGADRSTPATFAENVALTSEVTAFAHAAGVSVEGELGTIGGHEGADKVKEIILADPDQAVEFVQTTGVDALAVAVGTSHGAYKFAQEPVGHVLRQDLISRIHELLPQTYLVLHGSSSLPGSLRSRINAAGGGVPESWGVSDDEKVEAVRRGVRKINQGMDSHLAFAAGQREAMAADLMAVDPADALRRGREEMTDIIERRIRIFALQDAPA
ncbi:ketose-bisphosphate aldolase [Nakamurella flavida]|uniref:Ketose-bisphosphate aldolase n=1 Tax=Nakamurella flavida TaxID=363630 RepID=A0A939C6S8_9ACTN|nr:ketose-bisphosphate aldolase [Nakamurella flavida]MBM9477467.1 ketose-bisphosphate aldolase [Nakamurella flavida]MDP9777400.1 fructose-bisphosphate aldolase class II [Nakamurella flavida]